MRKLNTDPITVLTNSGITAFFGSILCGISVCILALIHHQNIYESMMIGATFWFFSLILGYLISLPYQLVIILILRKIRTTIATIRVLIAILLLIYFLFTLNSFTFFNIEGFYTVVIPFILAQDQVWRIWNKQSTKE